MKTAKNLLDERDALQEAEKQGNAGYAENTGLEKGTIVQITNEQHHWFPCLIIVDEIKSWGIRGYITVPNNDREKTNGNAFIRLNNEEFEIVGKANIVYKGDINERY
ncbi:MAG: hypothetical protein M0R03_17185 [Novosphingobium sp.]|nr:hypothetical protein [Novosphingobium sp.]